MPNFKNIIRINALLIPVLLMLYGSCSNQDNPLSSNTLLFDDTLLVNYQDTLFNHQENIWVTFDSLVEDSRCQIGTICKWSGNARVSFVIAKDTSCATVELNTYSEFTSDTALFGYSISLLDVLPYPHIDSLYSVKDYSAKILLKNGE